MNKCSGCLFADLCMRHYPCQNYTPVDEDEEYQSWNDGISEMYDEWVSYASEYDD